MAKIVIVTKKQKEVIDITDIANDLIMKQKIKDGLCHLFLTHTTAAIATADLDPGAEEDMLDAFDKIIPHLKYRHPHDPSHMPDHILSSIIGASLLIPFQNQKLILGAWQRVILVELNGPKERKIIVSFLKTTNVLGF